MTRNTWRAPSSPLYLLRRQSLSFAFLYSPLTRLSGECVWNVKDVESREEESRGSFISPQDLDQQSRVRLRIARKRRTNFLSLKDSWYRLLSAEHDRDTDSTPFLRASIHPSVDADGTLSLSLTIFFASQWTRTGTAAPQHAAVMQREAACTCVHTPGSKERGREKKWMHGEENKAARPGLCVDSVPHGKLSLFHTDVMWRPYAYTHAEREKEGTRD